jgi:hypothetical protein
MSFPTKDIAKLGRILGQAKRRGIKYVPLPIPEAEAIHKYLVAIRQAEYIKDYRKI